MTNTPISLQDLRRSLYVKAKAESAWRFWGLYVHVCKTETLQEAYLMAKSNDGAPGIDGVTFASIEESGREKFSETDTRMSWSTKRISPCEYERRRFRRTGEVRYAFFRFLQFVIYVWSRVRSSSSWNSLSLSRWEKLGGGGTDDKTVKPLDPA